MKLTSRASMQVQHLDHRVTHWRDPGVECDASSVIALVMNDGVPSDVSRRL
jgi:hypothetical protein